MVMAELERLEKACDAGTLSREAYLASVSKVQDLAYRKDVRPFQDRAAWASLAGLVLLACWAAAEHLFPDVAEALGDGFEAVALLGIAALLCAVAFLLASMKREADDVRWFGALRRTLVKGGRLVDYLEQGSRESSDSTA
ncbi:hypothetical protein [Geothrix sp. 21YS21S-2]|uniref:hypothetical protein n=1 Tax=Geothrix sp. 21YS21S-2 TaxID=3068893 RepID=UPI0027BB1080|nr:hypothetical protein [Geothrix sp. 21YS21S-2]